MKNSDTRVFPFVIAAGGMQLLPVTGEKFLVKTASGPVNVRWTGGELTGLEAGQGYNVRRGFAQLTLTNTGAGAISGTIQIADDDFIDNRIAGTVTISGGASLTNTAPAVTNASTAILAANALRKYLLVQNNHATATIYLNFSAAATLLNGVKIGPGGSIEIAGMAAHLGAVNAIGDIANNTAVIVVEG